MKIALFRYVLLLEDDVIAIPMFATLLTTLTEKLDVQKHIDYVKLYHPNSLRAIPSFPVVIASLISFAISFGSNLEGKSAIFEIVSK